MRVYWTLTRRELGSYFLSLTGYVIIAAALFLMGFSFVDLLLDMQQKPSPMPVSELSRPVPVLNQYPDRFVIIADVSQLPSIRCVQRPVKRGLSATTDALKICRISTTQLPRSARRLAGFSYPPPISEDASPSLMQCDQV